MKLRSMFQKDINRNINGVVKMDQNDEASLRQELVDAPPQREAQAVKKERVAYLSRRELCAVRRLSSATEIDTYVKGIKERLEGALAENDVVVVRRSAGWIRGGFRSLRCGPGLL